MNEAANVMLELDDIQSGVLRPRPTPYAATYIVFRIDDRKAGRELMRRVSAVVTSAANPTSPLADTWVSVALTYHGLKALGVPQDSLDSFAWEFRQGMAARAKSWGTPARAARRTGKRRSGRRTSMSCSSRSRRMVRGSRRRSSALRRYRELAPGITAIWRQDCRAAHREGAVRIQGRHQPSGHRRERHSGNQSPGTAPEGGRIRSGLSRRDGRHPEDSARGPGPQRHLRRLPQAAPTCGGVPPYLKANSTSPEEEELLAAKLMGRWRSGAPWRSARSTTIPNWGPTRDATTISSIKTMTRRDSRPPAARTSGGQTRDASVAGYARIHRMIRRGTAYGPLLPEGVLEDDGADRGLMFAFVGAHLGRQFEFVQSQWIMTASSLARATPRIPSSGRTVRATALQFRGGRFAGACRASHGLSSRGAVNMAFMPGLRALRWLADLQT